MDSGAPRPQKAGFVGRPIRSRRRLVFITAGSARTCRTCCRSPGRKSGSALETRSSRWSARVRPAGLARGVPPPRRAGVLLSGLIVWADWIASNEELFPLRWTGEDWPEYLDLSKLAARAAVERLGLRRVNPWRGIDSFSRAWPDLREPRPIQREAEHLSASTHPGLTIIEAPMGEGKTEAALYIATQLMKRGGGLYVALPTAATEPDVHPCQGVSRIT